MEGSAEISTGEVAASVEKQRKLWALSLNLTSFRFSELFSMRRD